MADLDAAYVEGILYVSQRQRVPHVEHNRQADDLGRCFEVPERAALGHRKTLASRPALLKGISSDNAFRLALPGSGCWTGPPIECEAREA